MSKTFRTQGSGASQTLHEIEDEKIPVYDTTADAEADLANLAEEQIVATKDAGGDEQTLIEYVDGRLETITTEIAMDTFKTGSKAQLYKSGNNVQFRYFVQDSSTFNPITGNTWTTIATIPEGLRPKTTIYLAMQGAYGGKIGSIQINNAGVLQFYRFTGETFGWEFSIQCDYNVDGTNSHGMTVNTLKDAKDYTDAKIYEKIAGTIKVTDCDTIDVPGTYNYDTNTVNTPDNFYGVLVVYGSSPDKTPSTNRRWIMQVATNTRGEVYRRQKINPQSGGAWTAWTLDVIHKDIVSSTPTASMNYEQAITAILADANPISWIDGTYAGNFQSTGAAPHQWIGTYQLTKKGSGSYSIMISGCANNRQFTATNTPSGWTVHVTNPIAETAPALVTLDGNACIMASLVGLPDNAQILSVKGWSEDSQGQRTGDWLCIPATNSWGVWYIHVEGWGGTPIPNYQVYIQIKYRIVS